MKKSLSNSLPFIFLILISNLSATAHAFCSLTCNACDENLNQAIEATLTEEFGKVEKQDQGFLFGRDDGRIVASYVISEDQEVTRKSKFLGLRWEQPGIYSGHLKSTYWTLSDFYTTVLSSRLIAQKWNPSNGMQLQQMQVPRETLRKKRSAEQAFRIETIKKITRRFTRDCKKNWEY